MQDIVQKSESRDYSRLKQVVVQYLEQTNSEKHFSVREGQHDKLASGTAAAKGQRKKKPWEIAYNGHPQINALEEKSAE